MMRPRLLDLSLFFSTWALLRNVVEGFLPIGTNLQKELLDKQFSCNQELTVDTKRQNPATTIFAGAAITLATVFHHPQLALANSIIESSDIQGISAVTQSKLGQSVREAVIGGAQLADSLDLKWERLSDSLRDEGKCDPRTNRRMFDNGTRRDGTKIGNPVLGALCTPEPLRDFDSQFASKITKLAEDAIIETSDGKIDPSQLKEKIAQVAEKVGPAFARAAASSNLENGNDPQQQQYRQDFNRDLYIQMRASAETIASRRDLYLKFEKAWGSKNLAFLAPNANRDDFSSPFPKPDPSDEQPYDEAALLDALGAVSVALNKLQAGGLIGHWEISIPEDDFWNVVTVAIDDDISLGGQILARESKLPLSGSVVVALLRSAMENQAKISYKMDTFFIDPTTTKQELYNPTQLLVSLSDLGQ